jgi:hypothetical protein
MAGQGHEPDIQALLHLNVGFAPTNGPTLLSAKLPLRAKDGSRRRPEVMSAIRPTAEVAGTNALLRGSSQGSARLGPPGISRRHQYMARSAPSAHRLANAAAPDTAARKRPSRPGTFARHRHFHRKIAFATNALDCATSLLTHCLPTLAETAVKSKSYG